MDGRVSDARALQSQSAELRQMWIRLKSTLVNIGLEDEEGRGSLLDEVAAIDDRIDELRTDTTSFAKGYADDTARASTVISDLQEDGMRLRMLPVGTVFRTFPRAVRDLARDFSKEVEFEMEGIDTELDKKVLEEINDPLIHILRNSIDHGIEPPDVREAAGKPRKGTIKMTAQQEGDHIIIRVSDDGAGIDADAVRDSAVKKGFLTEAEARAMSDREAKFLIFESGLSTSPIITEISGRGVGMDVVRAFVVEKLKGSVHVESELGKGTEFQLTIPLTLAIIRALVLRVGGQVFAIPTATIDETLRIDPAAIVKVEGRQVIRRQRRNIPLVRLGDTIDIPHTGASGEKLPIVVVGFSGQRLGFVADEFLGEQQIVIKTLGTHLRKVRNVAGVTVLGAGQVVVILNVPDLISSARKISGLGVGRATEETREGPKRILICEDSFTTRELERSIFEAAGFDVEAAADGQEGLDKLREGLEVDAVVTDVQMPNLDGFDLTRAIRGDEQLMNTPVIIVTSLEREEEKAEGIEAGADAYITKSVFNQDTLLDTVDRLIR
jgi:two-component system chemotaxis sensor kinase CheA